MPYLKLKGRRLFYAKKRGNPDLPPVLLLHGAGSNHLGWPPGLRRLLDFTVYALDLPGHGRSDPPGHDTIEAYAADVAASLVALNLDKVVIIGHSMGGAIAQMLALLYPEKVAGLILIGTGARLPVSQVIFDKAQTDLEAVIDFVTRYSWAKETPRWLRAGTKKLMRDTGSKVVHGDFLACNAFDVRDQLGSIQVSTLVIVGDTDMMAPPKFSHFLAEHLPKADLVTIEGGGHMMMLEQAKEVTAVILEYLQANFFREV